jgi:hypothetical protein
MRKRDYRRSITYRGVKIIPCFDAGGLRAYWSKEVGLHHSLADIKKAILKWTEKEQTRDRRKR